MADELKDQRIPIMMSPSEVKAIDDWAFAHRIRSRGEAIRRLIKHGITFEPALSLAMLGLAGALQSQSQGRIDEQLTKDIAKATRRLTDSGSLHTQSDIDYHDKIGDLVRITDKLYG